MPRIGRIGFLVVVGTMLGWGVTHAFLSKYQQKRQEIMAACKAARDKLSPEELKALAAKCPTPEIALVSPAVVKPGDTVEVTVTGKFPAGTTFLFESDAVEIVKESAAANSYRATIKIASGGGPERLSVRAFVPVCCKSNSRGNAITVGGNFEWELKGANGWTIKARSAAPASRPNQAQELPYSLEFYRGNETVSFEKRAAMLSPSQGDPPSYYFSISNQDASSANAQAEMEAIGKQMQNPNLSDAERDRLMKKMEETIARMQKDLAKMTDPSYMKQLQQKEEEFGCASINLNLQNGIAAGNLNCSQKVGRNIKLTGTMKYLGK
jgi:FKBP-type peptidyl-prolyl cis-trans isomerase